MITTKIWPKIPPPPDSIKNVSELENYFENLLVLKKYPDCH